MDSGLLETAPDAYGAIDIATPDEKENVYPYTITHLDTFLGYLYTYYAEKGFVPLCTKLIVGRLIMLLGWVGLYILAFGIDWSTGELYWSRTWRPQDWFFGLTLILLGGYWLVTLGSTASHLKMARRFRRLYREGLNLPDKLLPLVTWGDVWSRFEQLRGLGRLPNLVIPLTALDAANCVLRHENFLIALIQAKQLPLTWLTPWSLTFYRWALVDPLYTAERRFNRSFLNTPSAVRWRLQWIGLVALLLAPFMLIVTAVKFFLRYAQDIYQRKSGLTNRSMTLTARWLIREYNEPAHIFEERLSRAEEALQKFMDMYPSATISHLAQLGVAVFGAGVALLLILTVLHPAAFGSLVWALAAFSSASLLCREFVSPPLPEHEPKYYLDTIIRQTHLTTGPWATYLPTFNGERPPNPETILSLQEEVTAMYRYKVLILLDELLTILFLPFLLWGSSYRADALQTCLHGLAQTTPSGDFCKPAQFNPDEIRGPKLAASYQAFTHRHPPRRSTTPEVPPQESSSSDEEEDAGQLLRKSFSRMFGSVLNQVGSSEMLQRK